MIFHKIKTVQPLEDYCLLVSFTTGERKYYDVKPLFTKWEPFKALLTDKDLFGEIHVDTGGYGIVWNEQLDLAAEEIWEHGLPSYN